MQHILIADDNRDITDILATYSRMEGFEPVVAGDGEEAIRLFNLHNPDVVLLDVMMPKEDGYEVCRKIRSKSNVPVILITARGEDFDKIMGLDIGADDYIVKPFSLVELGARVSAHLRRENRKANISQRKSFGRLWIDYAIHQIGFEDKIIDFARKEYEIIELLSLHSGQVFSRERIYERIWGYDTDGNDTAVTEHIKRIRQKLSEFGQSEQIETVWGVGYRWRKG